MVGNRRKGKGMDGDGREMKRRKVNGVEWKVI